jgi:parallel beta-helix repeat protein
VSGNTITNKGGNGIEIYGGSNITLTGNTITNNAKSGIYLNSSAVVTLTNNTVTSNGWYGLYLDGTPQAPTQSGTTASGNGRGPVGFAASASGLAPFFDNLLGSGPVAVAGGTITADTIWQDSRVYYVTNQLVVDPGVTFTLAPGTVIKFAPGTSLSVYGMLGAQGTTAQPIIFTDYRDDTAGGDTNGDGTATTPTFPTWNGIHVYDGGNATLDRVIIRDGGSSNWGQPSWEPYASVYKIGGGTLSVSNTSISNSYAAAYGIRVKDTTGMITLTGNTIMNSADGVVLDNSNRATLSGNTISNNVANGIALTNSNAIIIRNSITANNTGIYCTGSLPIIGGSSGDGNDIFQNTVFGVRNDSPSTINAQFNWWGSASGPIHSSNPGGTGDVVTDYVDFGNYRINSVPIGYQLNVAINGNGSVNSNPVGLSGGINCVSGSPDGCSAIFNTGTPVTLMAAVGGVNVIFSGWQGACTNTSGNCKLTMDADKSVGANFTSVLPVKVSGKEYATLTAAYGNTATGTTVLIQSLATIFSENFTLDRNITATVKGGYNSLFSTNNGSYSTIKGVLTIKSGKLTVENVIIK